MGKFTFAYAQQVYFKKTFAHVRIYCSKLYIGVKYNYLEEFYACIKLEIFVIFCINTNYKQPLSVTFRPLAQNFGRSGRAGKI